MEDTCSLRGVVASAVRPDAHVGYGLPIGGVLALDNAIVRSAVVVDIACPKERSLFDMPVGRIVTSFTIKTLSRVGHDWA